MKRDVIDLSTLNVFTLFRKYFVPTLLGMLSMSAVTAIDGIFVGHGVGSDGIAAVNICVPLLMLFTGIGLMVGAGCSVVASIQLSRGKSKSARLNVTQALLFVTIVALIPSVLMMAFPAETARMLGSSEHLLPMVTDYLLWFVPSWVFQIWITVPLFVIRLDGAPKLAMLCSLITAVINVVLDWLFIFPLAGESWEQHLPLPSASWPADWWRWSIYCFMLGICVYNHSNGVSRACGFPCGILVTSAVSVLLPYWERQRLLFLCSSGTRYLCPIWGTMA